MKNENFLAVLNALGEMLEKHELTIMCQRFEIEELKKTVDKLTQKDNVK